MQSYELGKKIVGQKNNLDKFYHDDIFTVCHIKPENCLN